MYKEFFFEKGSHLVVAQWDMPKSVANFYYLVDGMCEQNKPSDDRQESLSQWHKTSFCCFDSGNWRYKTASMKMIQLPFSNDITTLEFPPLRTTRTKPTAEQEQAIKELVENMDLMEVLVDNKLVEAFNPTTTLNPVNQHLCRSVAFRALHLNTPLPTMTEDLAVTIDVPTSVKEKCQHIFNEIDRLFLLNVLRKMSRKLLVV
jgi:hypothetical protein